MQKLVLGILWMACALAKIQAQQLELKRSPFLEFLYEYREDISGVSYFPCIKTELPYYQGDDLKIHPEVKLVRNRKGLFAVLIGSGRVYKAQVFKNDRLLFQRIDSTYFLGNTFNSFVFTRNDTICNLGGFGYWRHNGILTYFTPGYDWSIVPLDADIPVSADLVSYLPEKGKVYHVQFPYFDLITGKQINKSTVGLLDLSLSTHHIVGDLNPEIQKDIFYLVNFPALNGCLCEKGLDIFLLDFESNSWYKLVNNTIRKRLLVKPSHFIGVIFTRNDQVFYTKNDGTIDSLKMTIGDFKRINSDLYISIEKPFEYWRIAVIAILFTAIGWAWNWKRNKAQKILQEGSYKAQTTEMIPDEKYEHDEEDTKSNEFTRFEMDFLKHLSEGQSASGSYSTDELNTLLGVRKKSLEVQKKTRTDMIHRINHKYRVMFGVEEELVERVRSEEDKRYFRYRVSVKAYEKIK